MHTPSQVEVWVLMGTIITAGFKGKNRGLEIHYFSKVTQEHLLQRENINILTPKQPVYQRFSFMNP